MSNDTRMSPFIVLQNVMYLLKLSIVDNYHIKFNGNFKRHITFWRTLVLFITILHIYMPTQTSTPIVQDSRSSGGKSLI